MIFITIAIPTYNRALKLKRLLSQFSALDVSVDTMKMGIEILVANNASDDDTAVVAKSFENELTDKGYYFSYIERKKNVGLDGNMLNSYIESRGEYVWYFSDDDILLEDINDVINDIKKFKPDVCISNFKEGEYNENNRIFKLNEPVLIEESINNAVSNIIKFPKISAYILKRKDISQHIKYIKEQDGSYYLFVAIVILVFLECSKKLMLRRPIIAGSDESHINLRYSPRIFANRYTVACNTLNYAGLTEESGMYLSNPNLPVFWSLYFIYLHFRKKYILEPLILRKEVIFVIKNLYRVPMILFCKQCYSKLFNKFKLNFYK